MTNEDLLLRIKQLIAEQIGYPIERITPATRLQSDTGMAGDDGAEFLERFQSEFDVDMSTLRYDQHFDPEGIPLGAGLSIVVIVSTSFLWPWLIPLWAVLLYFYYRRVRDRTAEIRVSDLLRSAELHRWTYDYPNTIDRNA